MTTLRQAAQQALEALEDEAEQQHGNVWAEVRESLRESLEQPEQGPVAWMANTGSVASLHEKEKGYVLKSAFDIPLYATAAQQRKPLTISEILNLMPASIPAEHDGALMEFARAIELAHGVKEET